MLKLGTWNIAQEEKIRKEFRDQLNLKIYFIGKLRKKKIQLKRSECVKLDDIYTFFKL